MTSVVSCNAPEPSDPKLLLAHARLFLNLQFALMPVWPVVETSDGLRCGCSNPICSSPGKHPIGALAPQGVKNATRSAGTIEGWLARGPINLGIETGAASGVIALDVDPRHDGDEALAALERRHGPLPETWRLLTGGGGEHILFRHPGSRVANSAGRLGPGLDLRGDGGYIVAPPSRHISGRDYAISVDHHPDDVALADMPAWLLGAKETAPAAGADRRGPPQDWRAFTQTPITEGGRNVQLTRFAGHLLRRRIDPHVALDLLLAFNAHQCRPPLGEAEVVGIVASIASRENARNRARACHG